MVRYADRSLDHMPYPVKQEPAVSQPEPDPEACADVPG